MKERLLKVLKWFFIILGIIFFIQILIVLFISIGFAATTKISSISFKDLSSSKNNLKQIQPIINYAEDYYLKNNKYPDKIDETIKVKKNLNYKYEVSKNNVCYTITVYPEDVKDRHTLVAEKIKQYQHCKSNSSGASSSSESYVEYTK